MWIMNRDKDISDDIFIRTERLVIRACTREDLLKIYRGDLKKVKKATEWPLRDFVEALPHFLNDLLDDPGNFGWNAFLILRKEDGTIIGDIGFKGSPDENGVVEIGYSIAPDQRGMGFATESVAALCDHAFDTGSVKKIIAECDSNNRSSINVLRTSGFMETGRLDEMILWRKAKPN